ncbi:MAG: substrate-binding domain-containing protein, partial [Chloroflexi bacterium]|nr:substrate-binding domain-containing protein [Chloroflexota bacterium]
SSPSPDASAAASPDGSLAPTPRPERTPRPSRAPSAGNVAIDVPPSLAAMLEVLAPTIRRETGLRVRSRSIPSFSSYQMGLLSGQSGDIYLAGESASVVALMNERLARDPIAFACDQLAIIVPADDPAGLESALDLGRPGLRIVALPETSSVSPDATQLVGSLAIEEAYAANIVGRLDLPDLLAAVAGGDADAAIVLLSDARAHGDGLALVSVPVEANVTRTLTAALLSSAQRPRRLRPLLAWLVSSEGQAAVQALGFLPAPGSEPETPDDPAASSEPAASAAP